MKKKLTALDRSRAYYRREIEGYRAFIGRQTETIAKYYAAYCWLKDTSGQGVHPESLSAWERICS